MIYDAIGFALFAGGLVILAVSSRRGQLYILRCAETAGNAVCTAGFLWKWMFRHRGNDSQSSDGHEHRDSQGVHVRYGSQGGSGTLYPPDDGKGWQGPAEGEMLSRHTGVAVMSWMDRAMEDLGEWRDDNTAALTDHHRHMIVTAASWGQFLAAHGYKDTRR